MEHQKFKMINKNDTVFTCISSRLCFSFIFLSILAKMGKKDKHKQGQSRNNPVFKVANGRLSKQKGKAKEVSTKLKKARFSFPFNFSGIVPHFI